MVKIITPQNIKEGLSRRKYDLKIQLEQAEDDISLAFVLLERVINILGVKTIEKYLEERNKLIFLNKKD